MTITAAVALMLAAQAAQASEQPPGEGARSFAGRRAIGVSEGGALGMGRLVDAGTGAPSTLRLGLRGSFFQAGNFPVAGGTNRHLAGELTGGYTFRLPDVSGFVPHLEVFGAYRNNSNFNAATEPKLVQAQGDLLVGTKGSVDLWGTTVGADLRFDLRNGIGEDMLGFGGSTVQFRVLAARPLPLKVPVDVMVNAGVVLGRSTDALDPRMTPTLLYGTGFSAYHRLLFGAGARVDLQWFSPFVTLDLDQPLGIGGDVLEAANASSFGTASKRLGLGARIPAGAGVFDVMAELGAGRGVDGFARTAPYRLLAGYTVALDGGTLTRPVRPPEPVGQIAGRILDRLSGAPVPGALVAVDGQRALTPVASDEDGRFVTLALPPGEVKLRVVREGYESALVSAKVKTGTTEGTEVQLTALPPPPPPEPIVLEAAAAGYIAGKIDAPGSVAAMVRAIGAETFETAVNEDGRFSLKVPPGEYVVAMLPERHVAKAVRAAVRDGEARAVVLRTEALPAERVLTREERRLVPTRAVELRNDQPAPSEKDRAVLLELADLLAREQKWKLRIGVHADAPASGAGEDRVEWTEARARAFRDALIALDVPADRVEATGHGISQPLFPNDSRERARNRRVEFELAPIVLPAAVPDFSEELPLPDEAFPELELPDIPLPE